MVYSGKYVMHMLLLNYLGGSKIRIRKILELLKIVSYDKNQNVKYGRKEKGK